MPAFSPAILLLFPGLGLVGLGIGLLARRYSGSALATGLTGLFALALASTWIATAGPLEKPISEDRRPPNAKVERLTVELQLEQSKRTEAQRASADADRRITTVTAKIAELNEQLHKTLNDKVEA